MSTYYNINSLKVRVSDHQPNTRLNGSNDLYIWIKDACGTPLSIGGQISHYCDKHELNIYLFEKIIRDFANSDEECAYMLMEIQNT